MMLLESEGQQASQSHLEARKAQALKRILHRFVNPDPSEDQQPESVTVTAMPPHADLVGGMRSLIEEMLNDPEFGDALRVDLAAKLREIAQDYTIRSRLSDPGLGSDQQRLFGTDQSFEASDQMPQSQRVRQVLMSLKTTNSDLAAKLQDVEEFIRSIQLTQLNSAVVLYVTSPEARTDNGAIIRSSVAVADSLGTIRHLARHISRDLELLRREPHELLKSVENLREATHQLTVRAEEYRQRVRQVVEDRLARDAEESRNSVFVNIGEMLNLGTRLAQSEFDPSLQRAFGSTGDLLTRSYLSCRYSNEEQQNVSSPV